MIPMVLKIKNFGSFRDEQQFTFPSEPGLYFMSGRNEEEPRLGANGSGKTTVWKALCWLFFEKTPLGLKAGGIANWQAGKGTQVSLIFLDSAGELWQVTRTWGPNSWRARRSVDPHDAGGLDVGHEGFDLSKGKENPILAMLAMDFMTFCQSVIMPQGGKLFLELDSAKQASLFGEVMQQDAWLQRADRASARARAEDLDVRKYDRQVASCQGSIDGLRSFNVDEAIEQWERDREKRLDKLEAEFDQHASDRADEKDAIKMWTARVAEHREALDACKKDEALIREQVEGAADKLREASNLVGQVRGGVALLREQTEQLRGDSCPLCGSDFSDHNQKHVVSMLATLKRETADLEKIEREFEEVRELCAAVEKKYKGAQAATRQHYDALMSAETCLRSAENALARCDKTLDEIEAEVQSVSREPNPYKSQRERAREEIARLSDMRDTAMRALDAAQMRHSIASGWVRWFKDIRLAQIGDALAQLELEANNEVSALGLVGWELQFDVDRQTASGSVARGFNVTVRSPSNKMAVPWESWSGGEAQRLIAATQMGLANLIRSNLSGPGIALEVWDEPTKGMSAQGVQDLLEALHTRALAQKRCIWVVDHHTLGFSKFAGGVCVVKTKHGSRFEQI